MTTSVKTCFKCGEKKELHRFYKHPQMADGRLNKCKTCTRMDSTARRRNPRFRENVLAYDRARGNRQTPEYRTEFYRANQAARKASSAVNNAVRDGRIEKPDRCSHCHEIKKVVGHHPDYSKPLDVVWLCYACHNQLHALLRTVEQKLVTGEVSIEGKSKAASQ
jgi:uncharacterized CHY-type Zn-finger protein